MSHHITGKTTVKSSGSSGPLVYLNLVQIAPIPVNSTTNINIDSTFTARTNTSSTNTVSNSTTGYTYASGTYYTSSSGAFAGGYYSYLPFNNNNNNGDPSWSSSNDWSGGVNNNYSSNVRNVGTVKGVWLQIQLPYTSYLSSYALRTRGTSDSTSVPKAWYVTGSNDGNTWDVIDSQTNGTQTTNTTTYNSFTKPTTAYSYYRLILYQNYGSSYSSIIRFDLNGYLTANTPLITAASFSSPTALGTIIISSIVGTFTSFTVSRTGGTQGTFTSTVQTFTNSGSYTDPTALTANTQYTYTITPIIAGVSGNPFTMITNPKTGTTTGTIYTLASAATLSLTYSGANSSTSTVSFTWVGTSSNFTTLSIQTSSSAASGVLSTPAYNTSTQTYTTAASYSANTQVTLYVFAVNADGIGSGVSAAQSSINTCTWGTCNAATYSNTTATGTTLGCTGTFSAVYITYSGGTASPASGTTVTGTNTISQAYTTMPASTTYTFNCYPVNALNYQSSNVATNTVATTSGYSPPAYIAPSGITAPVVQYVMYSSYLSGSTLKNQINGQYDLTLGNAAMLSVVGSYGCLDFAGQYFCTVATSTAVAIGSPSTYTVTTWVYWRTGTYSDVWEMVQSSANTYELEMQGQGGSIYIWSEQTGAYFGVGAKVINGWQFFVVIYGTGGITTYSGNGVLGGTNSSANSAVNRDQIRLGKSNYNNGILNGCQTDFRIYNYGLSVTQIKALYSAGPRLI